MKNLTLRIDEKTLAAARKVAALRGTTVAKLVREFLEKLVAEDGAPAEESEAQRKARMALVDLAERASARSVDWKWNRDEIYDERLSRLGGDAGAAPGFAEAPRGEDGGASASPAEDALFRALTTVTDDQPEPGHDEWFRRQVQKALDDKKAGKSQYEDFDKVAAKFGFNAR